MKPKINIKHYLNKKLKSGNPDDGYSVYYYITIKRRTILKPSIIGIVKEADFESGKYNEATEKERNLIKKVAEKYLDDLDNNRVNLQIKDLVDRGFNSKDEFVNGLNSYISYYYDKDIISILKEHQQKEIIKAIIRKLETTFDLSPLKDWDKGLIINTFRQIDNTTRDLFYLKNLQGDNLGFYCLTKNLEEYTNQRDIINKDLSTREYLTQLQNSGNKTLSIIEYMTELRDILPKILLENYTLLTDKEFRQITKDLRINSNYIRDRFLPIIDRIIKPEYHYSLINHLITY